MVSGGWRGGWRRRRETPTSCRRKYKARAQTFAFFRRKKFGGAPTALPPEDQNRRIFQVKDDGGGKIPAISAGRSLETAITMERERGRFSSHPGTRAEEAV